MTPPCSLNSILAHATKPRNLTLSELAYLIALTQEDEIATLHQAAFQLKRQIFGHTVALRGLIELSNHCAKDCFYCGIRRSNHQLSRYRLTPETIFQLAQQAHEAGIHSLVLQGGELESETNTRFIESCLERLKPLNLGLTLSLGEQSMATYRRWRKAGATRYLLRIETANPALYAALHPASHSWSRRVACLDRLRQCGYQVGTGVMCALPGQTATDLARDIQFFAEQDADMIGMGPYIPHPETPLAQNPAVPAITNAQRLRLGLNLIAATRLYLHDVNIAATTALHALAPQGRERGILAGANVIMPNLTDLACRANYQLYSGKPQHDETSATSRQALETSLAAIGETLLYNARGDSPHFFARTRNQASEKALLGKNK